MCHSLTVSNSQVYSNIIYSGERFRAFRPSCNIYEQEKLHAQLSWARNFFITSGHECSAKASTFCLSTTMALPTQNICLIFCCYGDILSICHWREVQIKNLSLGSLLGIRGHVE